MAETFISDIPQSSQQTYVVVCCVFLTATWTTLILRIWVRAGLLKACGFDDVAMTMTTCVFTGFCVSTILTTSIAGSGEIQAFSMDKFDRLTKGVLSAFTLYVMTMVLFKIALAIFYFRIVVRSWQKWIVYVSLAVNTVYGLFYFFIVLFRCGNPVNYLQNQNHGECLGNDMFYGINLTAGVINAVTDWALAIIPIFVLRRADLDLRTRLAVGFVLMLGTLGSVVSVVRLVYVEGLAMGPDFFRNAVKITIWSVIEPGFGITAACLITLRPLFKCVGVGHTRVRTGTAPHPTASTEALSAPSVRPASFSTWRTGQDTTIGYAEVEMQHKLGPMPTYQERLDFAKAKEEARIPLANARSRPVQPSVYSDRSYSVRSSDTRNFSRPSLVSQMEVRPLPLLPGQAPSVQTRMHGRAAMDSSYHHGRHTSKQTL